MRLFAGLALSVLLTGCAMETTAGPGVDGGLSVKGSVHGGQQPIIGAHIFLLAANTTGYGNASVSLLNSVAGSTTVDNSGGATQGDYFVTSGAGGSFSITGDYSCTAGTQVYLYALGGNPGLGSGANAASGLMAALGNCPSTGNFVATVPYVIVNEVSTIAAAYAFAGFATDATHVSSSGTALAQVGIANAFANAANLAGISTGAALTTTPAGNGVVPQATIDSLADILAACVNSNGAVTGPANATACYTLFNNALSAGTTGNAPSDTASAAINIAHYPGSNVAALFGLVGATAPFQPTLSAAPGDFTIGLKFTGGGLQGSYELAIDGSGNAWSVAYGNNYYGIAKLSSTGAILSGTAGFAGGYPLYTPVAIAIDQSGNAWVANYVPQTVPHDAPPGNVVILTSLGSVAGNPGIGSNIPNGSISIDGAGDAWVLCQNQDVVKLSSSGSLLSTFAEGGQQSGPAAIDGSGNVWIPQVDDIMELSNAGVNLSGAGYMGGGVSLVSAMPDTVAIDNSGSAWVLSHNGNTGTGSQIVSKFSSSGASLFGSSGLVWAGLNNPNYIAIDGAGNAWISNYGSNGVVEFSNSGTILSTASGYLAGGVMGGPSGIAIDGSGDVWVSNILNSSLTEVIGAATPVVTPLAVGVANHALGARP